MITSFWLQVNFKKVDRHGSQPVCSRECKWFIFHHSHCVFRPLECLLTLTSRRIFFSDRHNRQDVTLYRTYNIGWDDSFGDTIHNNSQELHHPGPSAVIEGCISGTIVGFSHE